jgi:hypothetical protein
MTIFLFTFHVQQLRASCDLAASAPMISYEQAQTATHIWKGKGDFP